MDALDSHDIAILAALQRDGKMSLQDLAREVNLSTSPCWRRVRKLEENGTIAQYTAILDARKIGINTQAYIHISLLDHTQTTIDAFDAFVAREEQIVECASITGSDDYLLKIVAKDPEDLETFLMKGILSLGIVRSSTTHFVLRQKKQSTFLPL
ncbi:Lrp/AsnC family transcriptional regulator [Falsihalocynthiibacter sp. S25ZX9]|uniref:Lrp/AsnC family transcriptional regulator n=1 Tax=Falsihalocynthiibacter sp. S25ZX9 TaxID=3240870 RepID=UPI00350EBB30